MKQIHQASEVVQAPGFIVSDMDGEKVMMSVANGKYYNLGRTGGRIWELIDKPATVGQIVDSLMAEYDVERMECERQVMDFLRVLINEKLIEVVGEADDRHAASS